MPAPQPVAYRTYDDAVRALLKLRREGQLEGMVAKIVESPYGGYRIKKHQADLYVEGIAERRVAG